MKMKSELLAACLAPLLASCANVFEYTPPPSDRKIPEHERMLDASFDTVWSALITAVGRDFFAIDNFEKASGLMTLSFSVSPYSIAIDSGRLKRLLDNSFGAGMAGVRATRIDYEGPYVDYLRKYSNATFTGRVNLVVRAVPESSSVQTKVTVNVRFIVASSADTFAFNSGQRLEQAVSNSGGPDPIRVMQSSGFVENKILKAIDSLFQN